MLGAEGKKVYILRRSKYEPIKKVVNLLIIDDGEWRHYTAMNLSSFLKSSNTKHMCKQHVCMNCLPAFSTEISRDKHFEYCEDNEIEMAKEGSLIKFQDGQYQIKVPFFKYTDVKAILEPIQATNPDPESLCTKVINQHILSGFCVNSEFAYGKVENPLKLYRGEDCVKVFCDYISDKARRLYHMFPKRR